VQVVQEEAPRRPRPIAASPAAQPMPMRSTSSAMACRLAAQAGGVDHVQRHAFDLDGLADAVARGARDRRDDGQLGARPAR
jgi:hypothetical protein